ncbi:hypothetical protein [Umezawaea tangerina]|uniref:Uncharacterized protein n=1 Tax=Umezawaea tangerina TaxID=84725 RepID=A0A2T0THG8_9PSEU|nr:hypothetical protein [Umezawaea tangerina]PRY45110.1 hypothetical protein CLV43_102675 [Umezawaea tangerina]
MDYAELANDVLQRVIAASEDDLLAFAKDTVTRLVREEQLEDADEDELTEEAWAALTTARATVLTGTATELRALLTTVDEGILAEEDLDGGVIAVLSAIEHWTTFLEEGRRGELYELAIRSIEDVDHQETADLDDFLAGPAMAAEYERIRRALTP